MKYTEAQRTLAKQRARNATEARKRGEQAQQIIEWDQLIANLKEMLGLNDHH